MVVIKATIDIMKLDRARSCYNCGRTTPDETHHVYCTRFDAFCPGMMSDFKCRAHKFFHELSPALQAKMKQMREQATEDDERNCGSWNSNTGKCDITGEACTKKCGNFHCHPILQEEK